MTTTCYTGMYYGKSSEVSMTVSGVYKRLKPDMYIYILKLQTLP